MVNLDEMLNKVGSLIEEFFIDFPIDELGESGGRKRNYEAIFNSASSQTNTKTK